MLLPICFRFPTKLIEANIARITFPAGTTEHIVHDDDPVEFDLGLHPGGRRTWFVQYRLGQKQRRLKLGTVEQFGPEGADAHRGRTRQGVARHRSRDGERGDRGSATITLKRTAAPVSSGW